MSRAVYDPARAFRTTELRETLEQALNRYFAVPRRIANLERRPSVYSSSFAIEELDVRLDDGAELQLIFKNLSQHALLGRARQLKPAFLYDPLREIEVYRTILAPKNLGTAACYGTIADQQAKRYGLFLEKVPGLELYQVGDFTVWQGVARWLAAMHTRLAGEAEQLAEAAPLLRYDEGFYWAWIRRARAALGQGGSSRSGAARHGIEWLASRYERVVERLMALQVTFIHGEFYAPNVLVQERTGGPLRVCPVDWEMAAVGPGPMDLAALIAGGWHEEEKAALAEAYHSALAPGDRRPPTRDVFSATLESCRLHVAVQWLGWFGRRRPFGAHEQDWLGEALHLAEKLGL